MLIQGNEKSLMKFAVMSAKTLQTVEFLSKILFSLEIMDLCLFCCFCIVFKRRLGSVTKVFMSEAVLSNLKVSEPIDA